MFLLPSFSFSAATESIIDPATAQARVGARVLVAFGDEDVFTGVKKYRRWGEKMKKELGSFLGGRGAAGSWDCSGDMVGIDMMRGTRRCGVLA
jgi:hypothetical protein